VTFIDSRRKVAGWPSKKFVVCGTFESRRPYEERIERLREEIAEDFQSLIRLIQGDPQPETEPTIQ
jgi:hypothetical protein